MPVFQDREPARSRQGSFVDNSANPPPPAFPVTAGPPRGQGLCWIHLCNGKPEVAVKLRRRFPEISGTIWVCRECAARLRPGMTIPSMPAFEVCGEVES